MPNRAIVVSSVLLLMSLQTEAQTDTTYSRSRWFVSLQSGALFAEPGRPVFATAMLMPGLRFSRLNIVVGAGYDAYNNWETAPVFAGIGFDVTAGQHNALYMQVNGGFARAWAARAHETAVIQDAEGGHFLHPMAGCRFHNGKLTIHFSAGYKFQRLEYGASPLFRDWGSGGKRSVVHDMQRLTVQMGIGFF